MKVFRQQFVLSLLAGMLVMLLILAVVPIPGIQAIGQVSHPNDIFTEVYHAASPSVVSISVTNESGGGNGSGFVIDREGHIVTNAHVIDGADEVIARFQDGTIVRGQEIGLDLASDIAVVKVNLPADQLTPIPFGDSDNLVIGQTVLAIGSPFGQHWTLTSGIVSAVDRTIRGLTEYSIGGVIQTDASINPRQQRRSPDQSGWRSHRRQLSDHQRRAQQFRRRIRHSRQPDAARGAIADRFRRNAIQPHEHRGIGCLR